MGRPHFARPTKTEPNQFWRVFGVGLIGYGISLGFQFVGTKLSTAANGSLVTSATPAFMLVFAWIILRERITNFAVGSPPGLYRWGWWR